MDQLEVQKLQAELAEYEEEFSKLKNQVCTGAPFLAFCLPYANE